MFDVFACKKEEKRGHAVPKQISMHSRQKLSHGCSWVLQKEEKRGHAVP